MASENFPVIIRCQDTNVAVPIKTLIDESTIFKALYESVVNKSSALSGSGRDSGCSLQDIQDLPCDEVEAIIENHNEDNEVEESEADDSNSINQNNEVLKETSKVQQKLRISQQFDIIDLSNFEGKSVRILFNSLLGHPELIEACNSLDILYGVLKICDEYGIASPIPQITTRFKTCDTITMANMLDAMKIAEDIEKMKNYVDISAILIDRCVSFARWNFASWQVLMKLITEKKEQLHLVIRIITKLRDEPEAIVRFKVDNLNESHFSSTFIIENLGWNIEIYPYNQDKKSIGTKIHCNNPNSADGWYCDANVNLRIVNQKTLAHVIGKDIDHSFKMGNNEVEIFDFISLKQILDLSSGFVKDNQVVFEAKITVKCKEGISESLGVIEEEMGWFDKLTGNFNKHLPEAQDLNVSGIEDSPVIFSCDNTLVAVHKFVLMKESSVFQAMFSEPWTRSNDESNIMVDKMKLIELTGYNKLSVKYLIEYLTGYCTLLQECKDVTVIGDMIRLCDFYNMKRPLPELLAKISNLKIDMKNVVKAYQVSRNLDMIDDCKDSASNLSLRCISFLRFNIGSWQVLVNFLVNNGSLKELVVILIEKIAKDNVGTLRFKSTQISSELRDVYTPNFIHHNSKWKFKFGIEEESFLFWEAPEEGTVTEFVFSTNSDGGGWGMPQVISLKEFLDESNGYVKDGYFYFEFELEADEPTGIPESLGVTEDMII